MPFSQTRTAPSVTISTLCQRAGVLSGCQPPCVVCAWIQRQSEPLYVNTSPTCTATFARQLRPSSAGCTESSSSSEMRPSATAVRSSRPNTFGSASSADTETKLSSGSACMSSSSVSAVPSSSVTPSGNTSACSAVTCAI